jgi:hypothetical protein
LQEEEEEEEGDDAAATTTPEGNADSPETEAAVRTRIIHS